VLAEVGEETDIYGQYPEVISAVQRNVECNIAGPAHFKRRILQRCGWRVITCTFDENEEYIAGALQTMVRDKTKDGAEGQEEKEEVSEKEEEVDGSAEAKVGKEGGQVSQKDATDDELEAPALTQETSGFEAAISDPLGEFEDETAGPKIDLNVELSEYESRVRKAHAKAMKELQRRVLEERGNAAASGQYLDHVEFRDWQVGLEREVFKEMCESVLA